MSIESLIKKGFAFKVIALSTITMIPNFFDGVSTLVRNNFK